MNKILAYILGFNPPVSSAFLAPPPCKPRIPWTAVKKNIVAAANRSTNQRPHDFLYTWNSCGTGEWGFTAELEDTIGDGWNAGGINLFDHFNLDSRRELSAEVTAAMAPNETDPEAATAAAATAAARRSSYKNTVLGGFARKIPVCLADGEYLFSTEFHNSNAEAPTSYGPYSAAAGVFSVGGRHYTESTWTICGHTGLLSDHTYLRVAGGSCMPTQGWGETASPSTTPVVGVTVPPTPGGGETPDDDGGENRGGGGDGDEDGESTSSSNTLSDLEIFAIGCGALILAGGAAASGTYAQNQGWFAAGAGGGAAGAAAAGAGGGAPNPDSDEFAP